MNSLKLLLDTNIIIALEGEQPVEPKFSSLHKLASTYSVSLFVHRKSIEDIQRDRNKERQAVTESKLKKYEKIEPQIGVGESELTELFGELPKPNDVVDAYLLHALYQNAVDFLVSEDVGLKKRAGRVSGFLAERVKNAAQALSYLQERFELRSPSVRGVEEVTANQVPNDPEMFDSLREGYPDFDRWWTEKCVAEHRKCWVVFENDVMAGIVVTKPEQRDAARELQGTSKGDLKLCTFKVKDGFRGRKLGELLLRAALWYCHRNSFDSAFLEINDVHSSLIGLVEFFGFEKGERLQNGDYLYRRRFSKEAIELAHYNDRFEACRRSYPKFDTSPGVKAYLVPIKEVYHNELFPDVPGSAISMFIFGNTKPGNTIRKVYICKSQIASIERGSILLFYKSKSEHMPSQVLTAIGVFEEMAIANSKGDLVRLTGGRSVFSEKQLEDFFEPSKASQVEGVNEKVKVLNFLNVGHFEEPFPLEKLEKIGAVKSPPQSIMELKDRSKLLKILNEAGLGFEIR